MTQPNLAVVDLNAVRHNLALAAAKAPGARILAVIKANAYGHGAVEVARAMGDGVDAFAVARVDEAIELRESGISSPILLLEGPLDEDDIDAAAAHGLWLMLTTQEQLDMLARARPAAAITTWLKIDSGMHRLGLPLSDCRDACVRLAAMDHVQPGPVLATHLACADDPDDSMTRRQLDAFDAAVAGLDLPHSVANSAAILAWPETRRQWIRPGYMLYGGSPFERLLPAGAELKPAMTVSSRVIALRDLDTGESVGYGATWTATRPSRIATVPMGYGDGYPRHAANGTPVLVNGRRAPLAGRVSMDLITIDVTDLPDVTIDSPVELWGKQLSVDEVARHAGTIGYELLAGLPRRLGRSYV
jgi:alanine racemase